MSKRKITSRDLMNPVIQAIKNLRGAGTNAEIDNEVVSILNKELDQLDSQKDFEKYTVADVKSRLRKTRTYLRKAHIINHFARGWSLTGFGWSIDRVDPNEVGRTKAGKQNEAASEFYGHRNLLQKIRFISDQRPTPLKRSRK